MWCVMRCTVPVEERTRVACLAVAVPGISLLVVVLITGDRAAHARAAAVGGFKTHREGFRICAEPPVLTLDADRGERLRAVSQAVAAACCGLRAIGAVVWRKAGRALYLGYRPVDHGARNASSTRFGALPTLPLGQGTDPSDLSTIPPHTQWASKRLGCPIASGSTNRPHIPRMLLGPALFDTCPKHMRNKRAASTRWRTFQSSKA
eukprot:scaffold14406_cov69-Phaeocystis_antarctica.AAC.2